jgi:hypothetical protein
MIRRLLDTLGFRRQTSMPTPAGMSPGAGDLFSVVTDDGRYGVMKVLAVDERGVHARLYVQRFDQRPQLAGLGELSLAPFTPDGSNPFSIGHVPLSHQSFAGWRPQLITRARVDEEELDGYRTWQDGEGGYF